MNDEAHRLVFAQFLANQPHKTQRNGLSHTLLISEASVLAFAAP